jgi:enterochelin esterase-like enzyme
MNKLNSTHSLKILILILMFVSLESRGQSSVPYQDLTHQSKVFGHEKHYRLYLPQDYKRAQPASAGRRFPVVYFFHGWGGRHFADESARLDYVKLQELVDKYRVIMVMWDGNIDLKEPRPYNVGNHEDVKFQVQMKDYFPELVQHIDATYRTISNRDNRSIIGFSMGGFTSLLLAGKYPDMVSAIVSMMGSPEFFVGTPDNHTLYPVRYTFENLRDVKVRIHTSPTDILYYLNEEVKAGAAWDGKQIQMEGFPGGHMVDVAGKTDVFEKAMQFVSNEMGQPDPVPTQWSHYDLYGDFGLWGYQVTSRKNQPGFIYLKDVTASGLGLYTKKWLPNGPAVEMSPIKITTAPVYKPGSTYQTVTYQQATDKVKTSEVKADAKGSIVLDFDPAGSETGIYIDKNGQSDWGYLRYHINGKQMLKNGSRTNRLTMKLLNRGKETGTEPLKVVLTSMGDGVSIRDSVQMISTTRGERIISVPDFEVTCPARPPLHAEPSDVKLKISVSNGRVTRSTVIHVPVDFEVPFFTNLKIDDGVAVRKIALGKGNGNGEVNPGEDILIYEGDNRLRIYADDPGIVNAKEQFADEMIPAHWPDGFTQNSIVHIAEDCRNGQEIECLASYETKTFNPIERKVTWGRVKLSVKK